MAASCRFPTWSAWDRVDLVMDAAGKLPTGQLTHYLQGEVQATGVSPDFSKVIDATGAGFLAQSGAIITLPGVFTNNFAVARRWKADGTGSRIAFGNVTNIVGPVTLGGLPSLELHAINGGVVELDGLAAITRGRFAVLAEGSGSVVSLSQLATFHTTDFSTLKAQNGGRVVLVSGVVDITDADTQVTPTGVIEAGAFRLGVGARILGTGTLVGDVVNGGEIRPGTSPGVLAIQGRYTQLATGKLTLEIGSVAPGTGHDQLNVTGTATLGGTLALVLTGGYQPNVGDAFIVLSYSSFLGAFDTLTGRTVPNGRQFQPVHSAAGLTVEVITIP